MAVQNFFSNAINFECYADSVIDYTAKFNHSMTISYGPENIVGKPLKYPGYGICPDTYTLRKYGKWWIESENSQKHYMPQDTEEIPSQDYLTVRFEASVIPTALVIYETFTPGAVVRIWGRVTGENWIILWERKPQVCPRTSRNFSPTLRNVSVLINEIRLDFNYSLLYYQPAFDAILLAGKQPASELQRKLIQHRLLEVRPIITQPTLSEPETDTTDSVFATLPYDVMVHIFRYLDLKTLCRCAQVNKLWLAATRDPGIYCHLSLKRYWHKVDNRLLQIFMAKCRTLKKLDLSWCGDDGRITEDIFIEFIDNSCKYLTHLSLCHSKFLTRSCISSLAHCKDLIELRLHDCNLGEFSSQFKDLAVLNKLITLDLYSTSIRDDDLIHILKHVPNLKHLNIDLCSKLRRLDNITEVASFHNMKLITWSSWKTERMSAVGVRHLANCHHLKELDLGWCLIASDPEDCLTHIAQGCKDLRRLIISRWRGVCDHLLLPIIRSCKQLTQLDLLGTAVSGDICEIIMTSLPQLKLLDISFCDTVIQEKISLLEVAYPNVDIHYSVDNNI